MELSFGDTVTLLLNGFLDLFSDFRYSRGGLGWPLMKLVASTGAKNALGMGGLAPVCIAALIHGGRGRHRRR